MSEMNITVIPARKRVGNRTSSEDTKKLRVAAYCRVSTDTDEQATSYDMQVEHYTEYIKKNPTWTLAGVYADDGISGTDAKKREEFLRMIDDCMAGKVDMVITKSISRFARNTIDCLKYIRQLKDRNIPVIFEKENINTMDAKGEILITIMASLSKNVKLGLQFRYQQGKVQVNTNWFLGYTKDEKGNLIIDPEQAEVVKRIFREYLEGKSCQAIAEGLMKDHIPNGAGRYKWWDSNIYKILQNEKYMGDALLQKTITKDVLTKKRIANDGTINQYYVENSQEAIIPRDIFHEVQAEIARRGTLTSPNNRRAGYCGKYALTGILVCGECGSGFRRIVWNNHGKKLPVWRCKNRVAKGGDPCFAPTLKEDKLHEAIVEAVKQAFGNESEQEVMDQLERNIAEVIGGGTDALVKRYEKRLGELQEELVKRVNTSKDYNHIADEIIDVKNKKEQALTEQAAKNEHAKQIREMQEYLSTHSSDELTYDDSLVRKLIKTITVYRHSIKVEFKSGTEVEVAI